MRLNIKDLSDEALWARLPVLAATERTTMAVLIEHLVELDERRLCVGKGFPSLFEYCVHALRFSEGESYRRIRAVRAVRKRPGLLRMLEDGSLSLSALVLLHPHLDTPHGDEALQRAKGLGARQLERLLAEYGTAPVARDMMRFVGMETAAPAVTLPVLAEAPTFPISASAASEVSQGAPAKESIPEPVQRKLVRIGFTADEGLHRMVLHAQQLMRHKYPNGSLEGIFGDALKLLIEKKDPGVRAEAAAKRRARRASGR
jgi:hypothetical protein